MNTTETKPPTNKKKLFIGSAVLALIFFCIGSVVGGAIMSSGSDTDDNQAPITQIVTQIVEGDQQVLPTYTPYPTYTPMSALPPIMVTPTSPTEFTEIYRFTGNGKGTTDLFALQRGIIRIEWKYTGDSNFALFLKLLGTDQKEMIENAVGNTDGQSILEVGAGDNFLFDIMFAGGPWEIVVEYKPN